MSKKILNIGVIIASTRPLRNGGKIAAWVKETTDTDRDANYTYLDLAELQLPFLADTNMPWQGDYDLDSSKQWSKLVAKQDGFLVITPEYNHGYPASLKNALDTLHGEWARKPAAFVGYGAVGAARSIEQLAGVLLNLDMHPITNKTTNIMLFEHLDDSGEFVPTERHEHSLKGTLAALKEWTELFNTIRISN